MKRTNTTRMLAQWCGPAKTDMFDVYVRVVNTTVVQKFEWSVVSRTYEDVPHVGESVVSESGYKVVPDTLAKALAATILEKRKGFVRVQYDVADVAGREVYIGLTKCQLGYYSIESLLHWAKHKVLPTLLINDRSIKYRSTIEGQDYYILYANK